ncbi:MAG: nickel pincer cofactor biosynthesis protein LarB [Methanomicrobiales archaeon]|nr:nickel pincer cofactor biosynthesis protein LarB [Methanomicrobiales archaeon]
MNRGDTLRDLLRLYREGRLDEDGVAERITGLHLGAVDELARLDLGRTVRCGVPEVVLAEGKEPAHLALIVGRYLQESGRCIVTRVGPAHHATVQQLAGERGYTVQDYPAGRALVVSSSPPPALTGGVIGIITAGTSDISVAEEAAVVAREMGCVVKTAYDVGAAGIHRLFPVLSDLKDVHIFVVAAGREGTLPAVVAGLVNRPVIGVPVGTGYGYMGRGQAALASMLQSCSVLVVVNIDAGFTAGAFAAQVANLMVQQ